VGDRRAPLRRKIGGRGVGVRTNNGSGSVRLSQCRFDAAAIGIHGSSATGLGRRSDWVRGRQRPATFVLSTIAVVEHSRDTVSSWAPIAIVRLLLLQGFMSIAALTSLILAGVVAEGERDQSGARAACCNGRYRREPRRKQPIMPKTTFPRYARTRASQSIRGDFQFVGSGAAGRSRRERALEIASRQTERLARIVDDLLDVERINRGKVELRKEPSRCPALSTGRSKLRARYCKLRDINQTRSLYECGNVHVEGDRVRLEQIVGKPDQQCCQVHTGRRCRIEVIAERKDREAVLRVRDTGIGLSREAMEHIFEPFYQAERTIDARVAD